MNIFRVRQHESKPLVWWYEQFRTQRLDMNPTYQRRSELWGLWKRAHLIDSILNEFDIPKFYIADFVAGRSALNKRKRPYAIIDGKQRFEAIFSFFQDKFSLNDSSELLSEQISLAGLLYSDLRTKYPSLATKLDRYAPVVMSVETDSDEMIDQMFVRLNSGEPANSAERRNAKPGPVPELIRELTVHRFFREQIRFNIKRMADFNLAAKLLLIEFRDGFEDTKASNLDKFVDEGWKRTRDTQPRSKAHRRAMRPYLAAQQNVLSTLDAMSLVFRAKDPLLSAQGHIPVYYWVLRNHPRLKRRFRPFLEKFTQKVSQAIRISREDPKKADPELVNYYTRGRTTNDQASLEDRYEILMKRLQRGR